MPPPRRTSGRGPFAVIAIVVGCVAGLVVSLAVLANRTPATPQEPPIAIPSNRSTTPTPFTLPSATPRRVTPTPLRGPSTVPVPTIDRDSTCPTREVAAVVPGWRVIGSQKDGAAFDVPQDFTFDQGVLFGQQSKNEMVLAHCAAYYLRGVCEKKSTSRGILGLVTYGSSTNRDGDPVKYAEQWARISNTDYKTDRRGPVPAPKVRTVRTLAGATATVATVEAEDSTPDKDCPAPRFRVTTVGIELPEQRRALLVIETDRGTDKDLPEDIEQRIITSLRPL